MVAGSAFGQSKPFPHGGGAPNGFVPTTVSSSDAQSSYNLWKTNYLKTDCGNGEVRVEFNSPTGTTVSEGMGYGMVLTAYFGDRTNFDGLWKFAQAHFNSNKLMGWHESCTGFTTNDGGDGSATDGDTDIGFALLVAADQWGATYKQAAMTYLASLKAHDYTTCSKVGRNMATNGDWDTGCTASNSSYWMPGYLRVFYEATGDSFWSKAADDAVALWQLNANSKTGLIANEVNDDGTVGDGESYVDYNGCRVPWRAITDYLWYGTAGSKEVSTKITTWANSIGISNLVDGYNTDGSPSSAGQNTEQNPWVGGWATGTMSDTQPVVNSFSSNFKSIDNDEGGYYGASLRSLYLLTLTGNFWKPGTPATGTTSGDGGASSGASSGSSSGSSGSTSGSSSGSTGSGSSSGDVGMQSAAATTDDGGAPGSSSGASGASGNGASSGNGNGASGGCSLVAANMAGGKGASALALVGLALVGRRRRRAS
jgi:endo-1,4-beta-D-glucanase Y